MDDAGPADAGEDAGPTCSRTYDFEPGDPVGHADPVGVAAGEARAGRLEAADLPADPDGLALWSAGDYVLANEHVAFLIENEAPSDNFDPFGGKVIGVASVEGGALVEAAAYNELIPGVGRFTVRPDSVGVLSDGSDGGPAVVRTVGMLVAIPFLDVFARAIDRGEYGDIPVAVDYVLEPGARSMDIVYTFGNVRPGAVSFRPYLLIFQKDRMPAFDPGVGFEIAGGYETPRIHYIDDGATSYTAGLLNGNMALLLEISGTQAWQGQPLRLEACDETQIPFAQVRAGGTGADGLLEALAAEDGTALREITGVARESDGSPAAGVRIHAESADGAVYYTRSAVTDETGAFTIHVPAAEAVRLTGFRRGNLLAGPVAVAASSSTADVTLGPNGFIHVVATDTEGGRLPVRVQVRPAAGDAQEPPPAFGEPRRHAGRMHVEFPVDGEVTLRVPPGDHIVTVSRGYEYELGFNDTVTVAAAATVEVAATLEHVVDTSGILCGDFHIHTSRSPDSANGEDLLIASAAGDGVELPARSDHEFVRAFEPVVARLGLQSFVYGLTSLELTTFEWGHFGIFPLEADAGRPNGGATDWYYMLPPVVFDTIRARPEAPSIIINHPRMGGQFGAYFTVAGYDAETGMVDHPEMWDEEFSLVEVFNGSSDTEFDPADEDVVDWFSLLRSGRRIFAVGSSDTHSVLSGSQAGYPRTCITLGVDTAAAARALGPDAIRDAMLAGSMVVSGGITIDAVARGGVGPGGEVTGAAATESVRVIVQAPSWVDVDVLEVWVNGQLEGSVDLSGSTEVVRHDAELAIDLPAGDSFVIFHAGGEDRLDPVTPGEDPFGVTNPIFFDR